MQSRSIQKIGQQNNAHQRFSVKNQRRKVYDSRYNFREHYQGSISHPVKQCKPSQFLDLKNLEGKINKLGNDSKTGSKYHKYNPTFSSSSQQSFHRLQTPDFLSSIKNQSKQLRKQNPAQKLKANMRYNDINPKTNKLQCEMKTELVQRTCGENEKKLHKNKMNKTITKVTPLHQNQFIRKVAKKKQKQLIEKWMKIDIEPSSKQIAAMGTSKKSLKSLKSKIMKSLIVSQLRIQNLIEGYFVRDVLKGKVGMQEQLHKVEEINRIIWNILDQQNKQRPKKQMKIRRSGYFLRDSVKKADKQVQGGDGTQQVNHKKGLGQQKTKKITDLIPQNPLRLQNQMNDEQNQIKNEEFQICNKISINQKTNTYLVSQKHENAKKFNSKIKHLLTKPSTKVSSTQPSHKHQTTNNSKPYDLSNTIEAQQSADYAKEQERYKYRVQYLANRTFSSPSMHIGFNQQKQTKYNSRRKLFQNFKLLLGGKQKSQNEAVNQPKKKLSQKKSNIIQHKQQEINDRRSIFLKKGHSKYSAIVKIIEERRQIEKNSHKTSKQISKINTISNIEPQIPQSLPQENHYKTSHSSDSIINSEKSVHESQSQSNNITDEELLKIIGKHKNFRMIEDGYRGLSQVQQQAQEDLQLNYLNKLKMVLKGRQQRRSCNRKRTVLRNSNSNNQEASVYGQNELGEQLSANWTVQSIFKNSQRDSFQKSLKKSNRQFMRSSEIKRWAALKPNRQNSQMSQIQMQQSQLLDKYHTICDGMKKIKEETQQQNIDRKKAKGKQNKARYSKIHRSSKQAQIIIQKRNNLIQTLSNMKASFKCVETKVKIEGPNVFCKIAGNDSLNMPGIDAGLGQYESIHKLKKPYYLNVNYSTVKKKNDYTFYQDCSEADFMKRFELEVNMLGQKAVDKKQAESLYW